MYPNLSLEQEIKMLFIINKNVYTWFKLVLVFYISDYLSLCFCFQEARNNIYAYVLINLV